MEQRATDIYGLRKSFVDGDILIFFNGPFSHSIIEEIGIAVRRYLESEAASRSAVADVFSVFVELAQNVQAYTRKLRDRKDGPGLDAGTLAIARSGERYTVSAGNMVECGDVAALSARLEELRGMDRSGLKALYKERLRAPRAPGSGAGLGLIEAARRASQPFSYDFRPIDDRYQFFSLSVLI